MANKTLDKNLSAYINKNSKKYYKLIKDVIDNGVLDWDGKTVIKQPRYLLSFIEKELKNWKRMDDNASKTIMDIREDD